MTDDEKDQALEALEEKHGIESATNLQGCSSSSIREDLCDALREHPKGVFVRAAKVLDEDWAVFSKTALSDDALKEWVELMEKETDD